MVRSIGKLKRSVFAGIVLMASIAGGADWKGIAPAPAAVSFAVIGDSGSGEPPQFAIARRMMIEREKTPYDFVIMLGDNIYGLGNPKYFKPRFEDPYRELLAAGVKFYAALGNHDAHAAAEHIQYDKFNMGGRRYYSFAKGDGLIEFFVLDTNEAKTSELKPEQLSWLEAGLKASTARWKVAYFHHSIYSSGRMHSAYTRLRGQLEPLFVKYRVNVVFSGHFHVYERIKPQQGVQYFVAGSGGKLMKGNLNKKSGLTAAGNDQTQIFLLATVDEKQMQVRAISADGTEVDSVKIELAANANGGL
ncbi:MAG: metallophosphoesterase [Blastocatellia bacterium]